MEFLKKIFNDELNQEGLVEIYNSKYLRDAILKKMENDTYDLAFKDWKEIRQEALIIKADEILDKYDCKSRFGVMKSIYNTNKLVPFIGAGMSMPSNYSGWTAFLKKLRKDTEITEEKLQSLLNKGEYEKAAQILYDGMHSNSFNELLESEYNAHKDIYGAVQYLPYIFKNTVITTNFDSVLKRCYDSIGESFSDILLGADSDELARLIASNEKILLKLHGKANTGKNRILTESEYNEHYSDANILKKSIETICSNSLLFLGSSLTTDRTIATMIEIAEEKGLPNIPRHYAFIGLYNEEERISRTTELTKANIFPIWYDGNGDHDDSIEALLLKLADGVIDV
ncbi:MAG: SIR2 family protein [Campylobacterota bacterium]|nr:SIR2 family protein [Campylobacterota bacterium]